MTAPRTRPAETAGAGGSIVTVLAALLGADTATVAALAVVTGVAPGIVTWVVNHGGIRGAVRAVWTGRVRG